MKCKAGMLYVASSAANSGNIWFARWQTEIQYME
jgi:hypothetical protein